MKCQMVLIDGKKHHSFFDPGFTQSTLTRGTEIKDSRPFLFGMDLPAEKKSSVVLTYKGELKTFQVAEIKESAAGNTYFLEVPYARKNYLGQN